MPGLERTNVCSSRDLYFGSIHAPSGLRVYLFPATVSVDPTWMMKPQPGFCWPSVAFCGRDFQVWLRSWVRVHDPRIPNQSRRASNSVGDLEYLALSMQPTALGALIRILMTTFINPSDEFSETCLNRHGILCFRYPIIVHIRIHGELLAFSFLASIPPCTLLLSLPELTLLQTATRSLCEATCVRHCFRLSTRHHDPPSPLAY